MKWLAFLDSLKDFCDICPYFYSFILLIIDKELSKAINLRIFFTWYQKQYEGEKITFQLQGEVSQKGKEERPNGRAIHTKIMPINSLPCSPVYVRNSHRWPGVKVNSSFKDLYNLSFPDIFWTVSVTETKLYMNDYSFLHGDSISTIM